MSLKNDLLNKASATYRALVWPDVIVELKMIFEGEFSGEGHVAAFKSALKFLQVCVQ